MCSASGLKFFRNVCYSRSKEEIKREREGKKREKSSIAVNAITRINGNCQGLIRGLLLLIGRR